MKTKIIMGGLLAFAGIANAQNTFPWPSSANVGIGTTSPNAILDVRGSSVFGGGATEFNNYKWNSGGNERSMILSGNPAGGSGAYGTLLLGSTDTEASGQTLGVLVFGQNLAGTTKVVNAGLKAGIFGLSTGLGGPTGGFGGALRFCTTPNDIGTPGVLAERMRIDMNGNVGIGTTNPAGRLHSVSTSLAIIGEATSASGVGVQGNTSASSGIGVQGTATGALGIGIKGISTMPLGIGMQGNISSTSGTGVQGNTTSGAGVEGNATTTGGIGVQGNANATGGSVGVKGNAYTGVMGVGTYGMDGLGDVVGTRGQSIGSGYTGVKQGIRGNAGLGATNYAGYFQGTGGPGGVTTYGVYSEVTNPTMGGTNYGVYSSVGGNGNSGTGPNWAGYFNGDVFTTTGYYPSDKNLKKNIVPLVNSLSVISQLNPVSYNFDYEAHQDLALPSVKQYGFISQEVQKILPELTKVAVNPAKYNEKGEKISSATEILSLNYNAFIAILAKGIQEQDARINLQDQTIADLKNEISALKNSGATGINQINPGADGFSMSQNEPNPFSHETVVKYTLPQSVNNALMYVYDLTGKQITTLPITEKGSSSITITSEKLSAGIYIYSIVADGKVVDSKRMIVADK